MIENLARILHTMQQAVLSSGGDPQKALGPLAEPWLAVRRDLGPTIQGKWATYEETLAALQKKLGTAAAPQAGLAGDVDFDPSWDPVAGQCMACGSLGSRDASGTCSACGSR